jgi:hypothetical protein
MRLAKILGRKKEATRGLKFWLKKDSTTVEAICISCEQPVTAACGKKNAPYWRHKNRCEYEKTRGPESEWHKSRKNLFPEDWQEEGVYDPILDKTFWADVKTLHDVYIECQRSSIESKTQDERERRYGISLHWLVDCAKTSTKTYDKFFKCLGKLQCTNEDSYYLLSDSEKYISKTWLNRKRPVILDFLGTDPAFSKDPKRKWLWCLLPRSGEDDRVIVVMDRRYFLKRAATESVIIPKKRLYRVPDKELIIQPLHLGKFKIEDNTKCPHSKDGVNGEIVRKPNRITNEYFFGCTNFRNNPSCKYTSPMCMRCRKSKVIRLMFEDGEETARCLSDKCGFYHNICPDCEIGVKVMKPKNGGEGEFPGCHNYIMEKAKHQKSTK